MTVIAVCLVVGALLAVVVGQALLANGQVRLSALQHTLSLEQAAHRQHELTVAQLETPARIVAAATNQLHMAHDPATQLPYVKLTVPLQTPTVTPAPPPPPPPATASANAGSAGNSGSTGSTGSTSSTGSGSSISSTTPTSTP
jgi:hypothetical protein